MPGKPHKWGFKLWGRCGHSGFLYDFDVYQGGNATGEKPSACGMGGEVVLKLVSSLPEKCNFKVCAYNFFTSVPLLERLATDGYWYVGTVRANRMKNCPLISEELKKAGRGSTDSRVERSSNIVADQAGQPPVNPCGS